MIEDFLEQGILIGCPLVKDINRAILEVCRKQRQALALSLRQLRRGKYVVFDLKLVAKMQPLQVLARRGIQFSGFKPEQSLKEVEVCMHRRKQLPVAVSYLICDFLPVEPNCSFLGRVET